MIACTFVCYLRATVIAGYIGGNIVWRIARKREKIAIGGYNFDGYGTIPRLLQESMQLAQYWWI